MWLLALLLLPVTVVLSYLYCWRTYQYFQRRGVKTLPTVPFWGNMFKSAFLNQHMRDDVADVYKAFPDDKYVGFYEALKPILILKDPAIIKRVMVKDFDYFANHRSFYIEEFDTLFRESIFFLKGQEWREMRATLSPAFTGSKVRHMVPFMNVISKHIINYLHKQVAIVPGEATSEDLDMFDLFTHYCSDVMAFCVFGFEKHAYSQNNEFYSIAKTLAKISTYQKMKAVILIYLPTLAKILGLTMYPESIGRFFRGLVHETVTFRKDEKIRKSDMIQQLINANTAWTEDQVVAQIFIFFFVGFESTASALTLATHELALNQDVQIKLREEVDRAHAKNEKCIPEVLQDLKYLDMVMNETLRKWSPDIIMDRECVKRYELEPPRPGGQPYVVEPGTIIYVLVNAMHMDEKYFPDPHKFDPERFSDENKHTIQPFTYMPFGAGPRNCMGSRIATMKMKVLLYHLVLNFELLPCAKTTKPIRLQPRDFNIRVANGSWLKFKSRK